MTDSLKQLLRKGRALRVIQGLSQTEMGERLGILQSQVSKIETGHRIPDLVLYLNYLNELGYTLVLEKLPDRKD